MGGSDGCRNDILLIVMDMIYICRVKRREKERSEDNVSQVASQVIHIK